MADGSANVFVITDDASH